MRDELTEVDIRKMREELDHRIKVLRPQMIAEVQRCRAYGDLSENFEYKEAKREKNRNDSRIRYLERMIKTARVIRTDHREGTVGLFDVVEIEMAGGMKRSITIVTTLRQNPLKGLISKESPVGKALMGRKVGDVVRVVPDGMAPYEV